MKYILKSLITGLISCLTAVKTPAGIIGCGIGGAGIGALGWFIFMCRFRFPRSTNALLHSVQA